MKWYKTDLHIHSVLSPCGDLGMSPQNIVKKAVSENLDIIAVTDHNAIANCAPTVKMAEKNGIYCFYGIEIQTAEEIHIVAIFESDDDITTFYEELYKVLPDMENDAEFFGDQVVVDENDNILNFEKKTLINSILWDLDTTVNKIKKYNGFCFPAHVDAQTYSIIGQLGFLPPQNEFIAAGISRNVGKKDLIKKFPYLKNYSLIRSSDSHYLKEIGSGYSNFYLKKANLTEIISACKHKNGRTLKIY